MALISIVCAEHSAVLQSRTGFIRHLTFRHAPCHGYVIPHLSYKPAHEYCSGGIRTAENLHSLVRAILYHSPVSDRCQASEPH